MTATLATARPLIRPSTQTANVSIGTIRKAGHMPGKSKKANRLAAATKRLDGLRALRDGEIVFHLPSEEGGDMRVHSEGGRVAVRDEAQTTPRLLEVWGEPDRLAAIIEGAKDARQEFLAGGLRVRGDLRLLSDIGLELGILKRPL